MLHRALDDDGPAPLEFVIGRICQEFHCLPSAAIRELDTLPYGLITEILQCLAYARAKAAYDARGQKTHEPPLTDLVIEHDFALVRERRADAQD